MRRNLVVLGLLAGACGPEPALELSNEPDDLGPRKLSWTSVLEDGRVTTFIPISRGEADPAGDGGLRSQILRDQRQVDGPADLGTDVRVTWTSGTMAVTDDGRLKIWGPVNAGVPELEDRWIGSEPAERGDAIPYVDLGVSDEVVGATGGGVRCAWFASGRARCWGQTYHGQPEKGLLGDEVGEMGDGLAWLDLGGDFEIRSMSGTCAVSRAGDVKCWGPSVSAHYGPPEGMEEPFVLDIGDEPGELGDALPKIELGDDFHAKQVVAGALHACALSEEGRVKCWGLGSGRFSSGQEMGWGTGRLGLEDTSDVELPYGRQEPMPYLDLGSDVEVKRLAALEDATCALLGNGRVKCWGSNGDGDLGYEDTLSRGGEAGDMGDNLPYVELGTGRTVHALVSAGGEFCALLDDRNVKCWGTLSKGGSPGTMGDNLEPVLRSDEY